MQHESGFLKIVNDVRRHIKETDVPTVETLQKNKADFVLVDVREDNEVARGMLPNALHIGKGVIERDIEKMIPNRDQHIVLYCGGGYRSALAAYNLQRMGYTKVESMMGGVRGWCEAGLPIKENV